MIVALVCLRFVLVCMYSVFVLCDVDVCGYVCACCLVLFVCCFVLCFSSVCCVGVCCCVVDRVCVCRFVVGVIGVCCICFVVQCS